MSLAHCPIDQFRIHVYLIYGELSPTIRPRTVHMWSILRGCNSEHNDVLPEAKGQAKIGSKFSGAFTMHLFAIQLRRVKIRLVSKVF